jgi:ketosteroid isomerase-like protein
MVSEVDDFLAAMMPRHLAAEHALCRGDAGPRWEAWSQRDPMTLLGAGTPLRQGWDELSSTFNALANRFSGLHDYDLELIAAGASRDLAYLVGLEHKTAVVDGRVATYTLRVTHIFRREDGVWKTVHRHGDHLDRGLRERAVSAADDAGATDREAS